MDTTHTTTQLEVADLAELRALPTTLHDLSAQAREIAHHAGTWVCATDGFLPSPVCVLRPLVPVMHRLEEAFERLGWELVSECERLAVGVERAHAELVDAEAVVVVALATAQQALGQVS